MHLDRRVSFPFQPPDQIGALDWVIEGEPNGHDHRVRDCLVLSYGYPNEHHEVRVSLRVDDRVVILGPDAQRQLVVMLLNAPSRADSLRGVL